MSASGNGARCARTTAPTATPGIISRTITRAAAPIAGARTASAGSATTSCICASALALWNERDPILKERLFGLTNSEGNHGEDVKELYYYLDGTPTHSCMRMLYKYPQARVSLRALVEENRRRGRARTGVRAGRHRRVRRRALFRRRDRIRQGRHRRHPDADDVRQPRPRCRAVCTSCRSSGRATPGRGQPGAAKPRAAADGDGRDRRDASAAAADAAGLRRRAGTACSATTKPTRAGSVAAIGRRATSRTAINDYVVGGDVTAVNPTAFGTKAAAHYRLDVPAGGHGPGAAAAEPATRGAASAISTRVMARRRAEADEFYAALQTGIADADARLVQRQAFAGMLWSKQFYYFDVPQWLRRRPGRSRRRRHRGSRPQRRLAAPQQRRRHLDAGQVGIPLVRRLGPRVSLRGAGADRPRFRQGPADAADARMVHAPERPAAGLRMGVRRRQPAGACLGRLARLSRSTARRGAARATTLFSSASSTS